MDEQRAGSVDEHSQRLVVIAEASRKSAELKEATARCSVSLRNLLALLENPASDPGEVVTAQQDYAHALARAERVLAQASGGGSQRREEPRREVDSFSALAGRIVSDRRYAFGFLGVLTAAAVLIVGTALVVAGLARAAAPKSNIRVEPSGAVTFLAPDQKRTAWFLMSPTPGELGPWVNTGIRIDAGERALIRASGQVNLAMHRMMESAEKDKKPPIPWLGPAGLTEDLAGRYLPRPGDVERRQFSLAPKLPYGALIGQISEGKPLLRPEEKDLIRIAGESAFEVPKDKGGTLWLAVNEIYFDETMRAAYLRGATGTKLTERTSEWDTLISAQGYWHIWFDDNAGSFLVTAEIGPAQ
jgi:hypothetical protein